MKPETIKILLIEDNTGDARLIQASLTGLSGKDFEIRCETSLAEGTDHLETNQVDVVLLDLGLPDSQGIDTVVHLIAANPAVPVIVLTGLNDETLGLEAVQKGAQDYLIKGEVDERILSRMVIYAIERKQAENQRQLMNRILAILNRQNIWQKLLRDILAEIRESTGMEAVGIRLKEGQHYPYFEYTGFPGDFIEAENYLCSRTQNGELLLDSTGNPVLECMCGNILRGQYDPSLPFYSEGGSFWTNSTTKLLADTSEADWPALTRNRCNQ
ncbi:MAG: response regulator, partial [Bacteroidota bacterium]